MNTWYRFYAETFNFREIRFFNIEGTGKPGRLVEMDETRTIFSHPREKATEDYVSGRFG